MQYFNSNDISPIHSLKPKEVSAEKLSSELHFKRCENECIPHMTNTCTDITPSSVACSDYTVGYAN